MALNQARAFSEQQTMTASVSPATPVQQKWWGPTHTLNNKLTPARTPADDHRRRRPRRGGRPSVLPNPSPHVPAAEPSPAAAAAEVAVEAVPPLPVGRQRRGPRGGGVLLGVRGVLEGLVVGLVSCVPTGRPWRLGRVLRVCGQNYRGEGVRQAG